MWAKCGQNVGTATTACGCVHVPNPVVNHLANRCGWGQLTPWWELVLPSAAAFSDRWSVSRNSIPTESNHRCNHGGHVHPYQQAIIDLTREVLHGTDSYTTKRDVTLI